MEIYEKYRNLIEFYASHIIEDESRKLEEKNKDTSFFEHELENLSKQNPIFNYIQGIYQTLKKEGKIIEDDLMTFLEIAGETRFAINDEKIIKRIESVILPEYKKHSQSGVYIHELTHALYYQNRIGTKYTNNFTSEVLPYLIMLLYYYLSQNEMSTLAKQSFLNLFITIPYHASKAKNASEERKMNHFFGVIKAIHLFSKLQNQMINQKDIEDYLFGKKEIPFDIDSEELFQSYENFLKNYNQYLNASYTLKLE